MSRRRIITLTTDFGQEDTFAGVMKGVILGVNPDVEIVDLTHGIRPYDIRGAGYAIGTSYSYFPEATIHVVVVDPGVGSARRPLLVRASGHYFIGPDNGVFSHILAGSHNTPEVIHLTSKEYFLADNSPTFQGRDVFAPVAAWLSKGVEMAQFGGPSIDYVSFDIPVPERIPGMGIVGEVIHIDRFGNSVTNVTRCDLESLGGGGQIMVRIRERDVPFRTYYAEAGDRELCCLINSSDRLEFFVKSSSAAADCGIVLHEKVLVSQRAGIDGPVG